MHDIDQFLMGGAGHKSLSFGRVGDERLLGVWMGGEIIEEPDTRQATDYESDEPKFWPAKHGKPAEPIMSLVLVVQTDIRDPEVEGDTGKRAIWFEAGKEITKQLRDAVRKTGADGVRLGGDVRVRWVSTDADTKNEKGKILNGKRRYEVAYRAPTHAVPSGPTDDPWSAAPAPAAGDAFSAAHTSAPPPTAPAADPWASVPAAPPTPAAASYPAEHLASAIARAGAASTVAELMALAAKWREAYGPAPAGLTAALTARKTAIEAPPAPAAPPPAADPWADVAPASPPAAAADPWASAPPPPPAGGFAGEPPF